MDILIAEDDYISRVMLKKNLTADGHHVIEAGDGQTAWQMYQERKPDMVLSDWMMPGMDGITLCREIRGACKEKYAYIMILTTKDEVEDLITVFEAGADDYISKPVRPEELKSRIKTGQRVINLEKIYHSIQSTLVKRNKALDKALSDLKLTQSQMLQSEKMASIGQLSAGIAHEINNPIGFISGNLDSLKGYFEDLNKVLSQYQGLRRSLEKDTKLPEALRQKARDIRDIEHEIDLEYLKEDIPDLLKDCLKGAGRISRIIKDLKNFARPGKPGTVMIDLNSGLKSTLNLIHNDIKYKAEVEVETDFGEIDPVEVDPQKLNQVFMNLLLNAGQAIEEKGTITVKTRQDNGYVVVMISDTGCGIDSEKLSKIFDPFYTTKPIGLGTGLGLSSVYDIIKEHEGWVEVESQKGQGTCFTIFLPSKRHEDD
nr:response regulator [uncultured Desulfobacter sp.]